MISTIHRDKKRNRVRFKICDDLKNVSCFVTFMFAIYWICPLSLQFIERDQLQPLMEGEKAPASRGCSSSSPIEGASLTKETQATEVIKGRPNKCPQLIVIKKFHRATSK